MRWILHRGNNNGPMSIENNPIKIYDLLMKGYEIEIDVWYMNNKLFLGHHKPEHEIHEYFLDHTGLWIHCKDAETLEYMNTNKKDLHYFYHTNEDYVLTSKGYIWCYVGKAALENSVIVMPEKANYNWNELERKNCIICSDYLESNIKRHS
jgi:hypothetical protein